MQPGLDRPQVAAQERDGRPDQLVVHGPWQPLARAVRAPAARRRIRVVEQPDEELHEAAVVAHVRLHLRQLRRGARR